MTTHANLGYGQERLLKVLSPKGYSPYQRCTKWVLPTARQPGAWQPALAGAPVRCEHGYHGTTAGHLGHWLEHPLWRVFVVEVDGPVQTSSAPFAQRKWVTTAPVRLLYELPLDGAAARWLALDLWTNLPFGNLHDRNVTRAFDWASTGKGSLPGFPTRKTPGLLADLLFRSRRGESAEPCKRWWAL